MIDSALVEKVQHWFDNPEGWCYTASEAIYYLSGGKAAGIKPMRATIELQNGLKVSHWWLQDEDGSVVDVTAAQFNFPFPYERGKGCGFQTKMKNDTKELIEWLSDE